MTRADLLRIVAVLLLLFLLVEGLALNHYLWWRRYRRTVAEKSIAFRQNKQLSGVELKQLYIEIGTVGLCPECNAIFIGLPGLVLLLWAALIYWTDFRFANRALVTATTLAVFLIGFGLSKLLDWKSKRQLSRTRELDGAICIECQHELATNPPPSSCPQCGLPIRMDELRKAWLGDVEPGGV